MTPHEIATIACLAAGGICGAWVALRQRKPAPEPKECETLHHYTDGEWTGYGTTPPDMVSQPVTLEPGGHAVEGGIYRYLINGRDWAPNATNRRVDRGVQHTLQ